MRAKAKTKVWPRVVVGTTLALLGAAGAVHGQEAKGKGAVVVGFGTGPALPIGLSNTPNVPDDFPDAYGSGFGGSASLSYYVHDRIEVGLAAGLNWHHPTDGFDQLYQLSGNTAAPDVSIIPVVGFIKTDLAPQKKLTPYVRVGGGLYRLQFGSVTTAGGAFKSVAAVNKSGVFAAGGFQLDLVPAVQVFLEGAFHNIFKFDFFNVDPSKSFGLVTVQGGLRLGLGRP